MSGAAHAKEAGAEAVSDELMERALAEVRARQKAEAEAKRAAEAEYLRANGITRYVLLGGDPSEHEPLIEGEVQIDAATAAAMMEVHSDPDLTNADKARRIAELGEAQAERTNPARTSEKARRPAPHRQQQMAQDSAAGKQAAAYRTDPNRGPPTDPRTRERPGNHPGATHKSIYSITHSSTGPMAERKRASPASGRWPNGRPPKSAPTSRGARL